MSEAGSLEPKRMWVPSRRLLNAITVIHVRLYQLTGGMIGRTGRGQPHLILTTVGRKSGQRRSVPLPYFAFNGSEYIVASNNGSDRNPGWWHNLIANPVVIIQQRKRIETRSAVSLTGTDRDEVWEYATRQFGWLDQYESGCDRDIPVVRLDGAED